MLFRVQPGAAPAVPAALSATCVPKCLFVPAVFLAGLNLILITVPNGSGVPYGLRDTYR